MQKLLKSDPPQHLLQRLNWNSPLMFVALHFITDQMEQMQHIQNWIDH